MKGFANSLEVIGRKFPQKLENIQNFPSYINHKPIGFLRNSKK